MKSPRIEFLAKPGFKHARMVVGLTGWMDGGEVSTGAIECLAERLKAEPLATLDEDDFYIASFPGTMEFAALFRPSVRIKDGLIRSLDWPATQVLYCPSSQLVLWSGREPNLRWQEYADTMLTLASACEVGQVHFIGSVAGLVPHTREPRFHTSVSDERLLPPLLRQGYRLSNYQGPSSITTFLTRLAPRHGIDWINSVAEIPAYIQGRNFRCIRAAVHRLAGLLGLNIDLEGLRLLADQMEEQLTKAVAEQPELAERITKLEEDYDNDIFDTELGDLKDWLQRQGIRLD
jgi:hypothetical protein